MLAGDAVGRARPVRHCSCSRARRSASSARPRTGSCSASRSSPPAAMLSLVGAAAGRGERRARACRRFPSHVREASYAVGKTKIATTRRVLLPAARPSVITGAMLGARARDRRHRDHRRSCSAGRSRSRPRTRCRCSALLRGTGDTLTELHLLQRAHRRGQPAVQGVRGGVRADADRARAERRRRASSGAAQGGCDGAEKAAAGPAPDRRGGRRPAHRLGVADAAPAPAPAPSPPERNGNGHRAELRRAPPPGARRRRSRSTAWHVEELSVAYGAKRGRQRRSRCRSARARCWR